METDVGTKPNDIERKFSNDRLTDNDNCLITDYNHRTGNYIHEILAYSLSRVRRTQTIHK
ncbi:MAG: hypothetical protein IPL67_05210 [Ignavibacteria bacterium]|nr:hypothetical protein [Ignavibacteria bacterium]